MGAKLENGIKELFEIFEIISLISAVSGSISSHAKSLAFYPEF